MRLGAKNSRKARRAAGTGRGLEGSQVLAGAGLRVERRGRAALGADVSSYSIHRADAHNLVTAGNTQLPQIETHHLLQVEE